MIPKPIEEIQIDDIQALKDSERSEDRTIEYKSILPTKAESQKIRFLLKPVCSLANTDGGDLVFGIKEKKGVPKDICGVDIDDQDAEKLRLENLIQNGIEPQIRGIKIRIVKMLNDKHALIVRIPQSWTAPHRVKSNSRFYARNSSGGYELDVPQIRQSFILTEKLAQRIRDFRTDRIASIIGGDTPIHLRRGAKVSVHIVPLVSFSRNMSFNIDEIESLYPRLKPNGFGGIQNRLNFDGIVIYGGNDEQGYRAYTQFFRSGIIEFVWVYEVHNENRNLLSYDYENKTIQNYISGMNVLRDIGIIPPVFVFLTISSLSGFSLYLDENLRFKSNLDEDYRFDRNILAVQEVEVNSFDRKPNEILRPLFDIVWNSAGLKTSLNFDENDEFIKRH